MTVPLQASVSVESLVIIGGVGDPSGVLGLSHGL